MTKYTRSMNKLSSCIKDIFNSSDISIDTKSILLVLAATMSTKKFKVLLAPLSELNSVYAPLVEINAMRSSNGSMFRDYIILTALQSVESNVNSDELQRIMANASSSSRDPRSVGLLPALSTNYELVDLGHETNQHLPEFAALKHETMKYLLENLELDNKNQINTLIEAYLHNRLKQEPTVAYGTLVQAMADILTAGGFDEAYSQMYSSKIAQHALHEFLQNDKSNPQILHTFNSFG